MNNVEQALEIIEQCDTTEDIRAEIGVIREALRELQEWITGLEKENERLDLENADLGDRRDECLRRIAELESSPEWIDMQVVCRQRDAALEALDMIGRQTWFDGSEAKLCREKSKRIREMK